MTQLLKGQEMDCLVEGYCKESETKSCIPRDIIDVCLSFYDPNIYVKISKQDINEIISDPSSGPITTSIHISMNSAFN